jgi:hypothetical protein
MNDLVHDGLEPNDSQRAPVRRPCPACGAPCPFDALEVVHRGTDIGWATTADIEALQTHVLRWLPLVTGEFDGRRHVASALDDHCQPSAASVMCPTCTATCLAVVSYGEFQPARWWVVVEGLVPAQS